MLNIRRNKLRRKIESLVANNDTEGILNAIDEYEQDNLNTIEKLNRVRKLEVRRINGALKQTINFHGPITRVLIGSATKRIMGSLLVQPKTKEKTKKIKIKYVGWFFIFLWQCIKDLVQTPHHCFGEIALFKENWSDFKSRLYFDNNPIKYK